MGVSFGAVARSAGLMLHCGSLLGLTPQALCCRMLRTLMLSLSMEAYSTARSVISKPLSMIANASRNSASVIQSGGLVKKVFQRTKV
jgi:hypothetical protein